jgi:hypothetical protein
MLFATVAVPGLGLKQRNFDGAEAAKLVPILMFNI